FASPMLRQQLALWGFEVVTCPLDQFMLAGGAAKCLVLRLVHDGAQRAQGIPRPPSAVRERMIEVQGHLLDTDLMNRFLDCITEGGGGFDIEAFQPGLRHDQGSVARLRVIGPSPERLDTIIGRLIQMGARVLEDERDARLEPVTKEGVAPDEFYSTTIYPTEVRVRGRWVKVVRQRMDGMLVVDVAGDEARVQCRLLRDLRVGDMVACGIDGVRTHPTVASRSSEGFGFMSAEVSSERRVELSV